MVRILRWSAAVAAIAIPVIIIVSAITEPRQSVVFDCVGTKSTCDGVFADRAERWGPSALLVVVAVQLIRRAWTTPAGTTTTPSPPSQ